MRKVAVILGSDSDLPNLECTFKTLNHMAIPFEVHIYSAHRTPLEAIDFAKNSEANGFGVIIAAAGKAAHLAGTLASNTILPVIGIPISARPFDGMDALLSTVQMPNGVPVATVAIDGALNAALLAVEILALTNDELRHKLLEQRDQMRRSVLEKDKHLQMNDLIRQAGVNHD